MRHTDTVRTIWADAVCINQDDILERNKQVTRMADIYRLAHRVVVWLGPETANSSLAMATLDYLGSQVDFTTGNFRAASPEAVHRDWYMSATELPYDETTWRAVLDLLLRPWFDRLWVMQEVQLAHPRRTVLCCGRRHAIPWSHVRRAVMTLGGKTRFPIPGTKARIMRIRPMVMRLTNKPLHSLLAHIRDRHCSDPRDKIYGVLSIVPGDVAARIHPDYSAPVADVYREAFLVSTEQTQRIRFYSYSSSGSTKVVADMPSWVPDWTAPVSLDNTMYAFCSSLSSSCATFEPPDMLRVWGVHCGTISAVSQPLAVNGSPESVPYLRDWSLQHALVRDVYPTGETSMSALAATLLVGSVQERFAQPVGIFPHADPWIQLLSDYMFQHQSAGDPKKVGATIYSIFNEECQLWLFQTDQGYLGMTGTQTKPGKSRGGDGKGAGPFVLLGITERDNTGGKNADHTCLVSIGDRLYAVLGSRKMVILRSRGAANTHEVVGETYVHGFMDGEAFLQPVPKPWRVLYRANSTGQWYATFANTTTGEVTQIDPRLGPPPAEWEQVSGGATRAADDQTATRFQHKVSGDVIESYPQLLPGPLQQRGIGLEEVRLV